MNKHHSWMVVSFSLAAALSACGGGGSGGGSLPSTEGASNTATTQNTEARTTSSLSTANAAYTAIDAGGSATGNWMADVDSNGGSPFQIWSAVNTKLVPSPAPQLVYQTQRWGQNLTYTVPNLTPNGSYAVRLHFVESYYQAAGKRVFSVKANGQSVVTNLDIYKEAGGVNIAIVKAFTSKADAAGKIVVQMTSTVDNPSIAGLEFTSQSSTALPVLPGADINAGGASSGLWIADANFSGGWTKTVMNAIKTNLVSNPASQAVYQSQRTGTKLAYSIGNMTPNGAYTVRLHFVESWFTSAGQRLFNVSINGSQVLSNFDIYQAAGAANTAIAKAFDVKANASGKIAIALTATVDNASLAGIEIVPTTTSTGPTAVPTIIPTPGPAPSATPTAVSGGSCSPTARNPIFHGCFTGNSPYHHTVANLMSYGGSVSSGSNAMNYWKNGSPINSNNVGSGVGGHGIWISSWSSPQYSVQCPAYGTCNAATSVTGKKVYIPSGAAPSGDSDHHFTLIDQASGQEIDMWGGYASNQACQVGTYTAGVLTCSWGGTFPFSGNGLASLPGHSGNAGGVAFGMAGLTAGDILSGHITHALAMLGPCLDDGGIYPGTPGRTSDYPCRGGRIPSGGTPAEPSVPYGALLALKPSVNLNAPPYSNASQYCKVILKVYQEYGFYADDNSSGYGLRLILNNQADPGWNIINASMISGGDASGSSSSANNQSCLNRINGSDLEAISLNKGNGTIPGGNSVLPPLTSP